MKTSINPSSWSPVAGSAFVFIGGMVVIGAFIVADGGRPWFSWFLAVLGLASASVASFRKHDRRRLPAGRLPAGQRSHDA